MRLPYKVYLLAGKRQFVVAAFSREDLADRFARMACGLPHHMADAAYRVTHWSSSWSKRVVSTHRVVGGRREK